MGDGFGHMREGAAGWPLGVRFLVSMERRGATKGNVHLGIVREGNGDGGRMMGGDPRMHEMKKEVREWGGRLMIRTW